MRFRAVLFWTFASTVCTGAIAQNASDDGAGLFPYRDGAGLVVRHAGEMKYPFRSGTQPGQRFSTGFENVLDCLPPAEAAKAKPDLTSYDLENAPSRLAVETCIFRIAASYGTPDDMAVWLSQKSPDVTVRHDSCCVEKTTISGTWDLSVSSHPWKASWFERFWDEQAGITIYYSLDGEVLKVFGFTLD